jgi:hypothetical protein
LKPTTFFPQLHTRLTSAVTIFFWGGGFIIIVNVCHHAGPHTKVLTRFEDFYTILRFLQNS